MLLRKNKFVKPESRPSLKPSVQYSLANLTSATFKANFIQIGSVCLADGASGRQTLTTQQR